jgi:hypothetical protein
MFRASMRQLYTVLAVACSLAAPSHAADLLVPSQFPTIQSAIDAAEPGDTVLVARGIYVERINLSGKAITLKSAEGSAVTTITPGTAAGAVVTCQTNETAACVIDGFTITGATNGPGIQLVTASPTIRNCVVSQNLNSSTGGAGVAFTGTSGNPTFTDCYFIGNVAIGRDGGAISSAPTAGTLTCLRCTFRSNEVRESFGGGAVYATGATTVFTECVFENNSIVRLNADNRGGAIYTSSACSLTDCVFTANSVTTNADSACADTFAKGGAIYALSAITANRVTFQSNVAQAAARPCRTGFALGGAVVLDTTAVAEFVDCTFTSNSARNPLTSCSGGRQAKAGAVWVTGGNDPLFLRCHFSGNRAENCTGYAVGGTLLYEGGCDGNITDCTISAGYANSEGGGVWIATGAAPSIVRTTFSDCSTNAGAGGGLLLASSSLVALITDCRFSNCQATTGGAVYVANARPRFDRCVFDHNTGTSGSAVRAVGTDSLTIPTICYSTFCSNSGAADTNWILGSYSDPHPGNGSNSLVDSCGEDCNANGIDDTVEIGVGLASDCDANGIPDDCQADCDSDGVPDVCDIPSGAGDCDANGVPDSCEIASGAVSDANQDGIPDGCQSEVTFTGLVTEIVPITDAGTGLPVGAVCWRVYAELSDPGATVLAIYGDAVDPLAISADGGFWQAPTNFDPVFPTLIPCTEAPAGIRYDSYLTIGADCGDGAPLAQIGLDFADFASSGGAIGMLDAQSGAIVYSPSVGIEAGASGRVLLMQLTTNSGSKPIGQFNVLGESPTKAGPVEWNAYAVAIPDPVLVDCNGNGVHDALDISAGAASDCDLSGVPDSCESSTALADCDGDGVSDFCEIAAGASDANGNGKPDECECVGDVDGNGAVNVDDVIDVIVAWGDFVVGGPDLDGDGVVGPTDLALVLQGWGTCEPISPPAG